MASLENNSVANGPKVAKRTGGRTGFSDDEIAERITAAIVEHRLPPGTKLGEDRLGAAFGVSRTRIRQVLFRLAAEKVVVQRVNRGAFVAEPTAREAQEVFDARREIESVLVDRLARAATPAQVARLRAHLGRETAAQVAGDTRAAIKLSGEFHVLIGEMAGNGVLAEMLRELVARASLIVAVFGSPRTPNCAADEHAGLVDAVRRREGRAAAHLMRSHLSRIEGNLLLREEAEAPVDLARVLAELAG
jgi:DNA-binding GntR family transcriptional regulator